MIIGKSKRVKKIIQGFSGPLWVDLVLFSMGNVNDGLVDSAFSVLPVNRLG